MKVQAHSSLTTTGIQSGPNAFDESRLIMTFLTLLEVIEVLCSFRLVLEGKTGKEIPKSSRLESYSVGTNEKSDFYKLWQQYKLLKTMEMSEV